MPYSDRYITLVRVGRIVTACAYITLTSNFNQVGNVSVTETIPEGFRPSGDSRAVMRGTDNSGAISFYLYGTADGKMVLNGTGYTSRFVGISGCWITAQHSLTQRSTKWSVPYSNDSILLTRVGDICFMGGNVKFAKSGENNYVQAQEIIPVGYRPAEKSNTPIAVFGGNTTFILYGEHTGRVTMLGNPNSAYAGCTGVWRTADPMPAQLSLSPTRFTFGNPQNGKVGTIANRDSITRISGMAMLGSGTLVPIPFVHPSYPNRSVSVSIATNGSIAVLNGNEISISSGFVDVFTR